MMNFLFSASTKIPTTSQIPLRRFVSTASKPKHLARIFVFPLTDKKSFIYFKYNEEQLNNQSPLIKYEEKAVGFATKGWNKLRDSEKSYNKKIVYYVTKFLEQTPWTEDSLRSIPSKSALLRQVRRDEKSSSTSTDTQGDTKLDKNENLVLTSVHDLKENEKLVAIPVLYPSSIINSATHLKEEVIDVSQKGLVYHRKQMIWNAIGIPFTIPFIIVPVVPNIPGFYLAYRFYCNFKAFLGAQHLLEICQRESDLKFTETNEIDEIYAHSLEKHGKILINEGIIEKLVETFDIKEAHGSLIKALRQERKAIKKASEEHS